MASLMPWPANCSCNITRGVSSTACVDNFNQRIDAISLVQAILCSVLLLLSASACCRFFRARHKRVFEWGAYKVFHICHIMLSLSLIMTVIPDIIFWAPQSDWDKPEHQGKRDSYRNLYDEFNDFLQAWVELIYFVLWTTLMGHWLGAATAGPAGDPFVWTPQSRKRIIHVTCSLNALCLAHCCLLIVDSYSATDRDTSNFCPSVQKLRPVESSCLLLGLVLLTWIVMLQMARRFFALGIPARQQLPVWLLFFVSSLCILGRAVLYWPGVYHCCDTQVLEFTMAAELIPTYLPPSVFLCVMWTHGEEELVRMLSIDSGTVSPLLVSSSSASLSEALIDAGEGPPSHRRTKTLPSTSGESRSSSAVLFSGTSHDTRRSVSYNS